MTQPSATRSRLRHTNPEFQASRRLRASGDAGRFGPAGTIGCVAIVRFAGAGAIEYRLVTRVSLRVSERHSVRPTTGIRSSGTRAPLSLALRVRPIGPRLASRQRRARPAPTAKPSGRWLSNVNNQVNINQKIITNKRRPTSLRRAGGRQ